MDRSMVGRSRALSQLARGLGAVFGLVVAQAIWERMKHPSGLVVPFDLVPWWLLIAFAAWDVVARNLPNVLLMSSFAPVLVGVLFGVIPWSFVTAFLASGIGWLSGLPGGDVKALFEGCTAQHPD
ncbi:MAG: hypothetical protein ACE5JQ_07995 [Candidatus Methylomirabilales bacterium]